MLLKLWHTHLQYGFFLGSKPFLLSTSVVEARSGSHGSQVPPMWTSPALEAKSQLLSLKRPIKYNYMGLRIWGMLVCNLRFMYKSQVPSPTQSHQRSLECFYHHGSMHLSLFSKFIAINEKKTTHSYSPCSLHGYKTCDCRFFGNATNYHVWKNFDDQFHS